MKATPKLQDTLEVFLEDLEKLDTTMKEFKDFSPLFSAKIQELKDIKIQPDMGQISLELYNMKSEISNNNDFLKSLFSDHRTKLEDQYKKQKGNLSSLYLCILVLFIVTIGSVYLMAKSIADKKNISDELVLTQQYNQRLESFIKESKQINNYKKWLDSKKTK